MHWPKLGHRKEIEAQVLELIQDIPQTEILLSMPGIGPRSTAQIPGAQIPQVRPEQGGGKVIPRIAGVF